MSTAPADLLSFRAEARRLTGLPANAVGIVGDGAHQRTGGYHEGEDVLRAIGRYHDPAAAHVGSSTEDYSARQLRDRLGLDDSASGLDIGDAWSAGRAAWLRYNSMLYTEMRDHPERLPALRAINVSLDGRTKRRYDQTHRGDGLTPSTDSVDSHTHHEYWRDTEGKPERAHTLARQLQLIALAIDPTKGEDMGDYSPDTACALAIGATSAGDIATTAPGWDGSLSVYNLRSITTGQLVADNAPIAGDETRHYNLKVIVEAQQALGGAVKELAIALAGLRELVGAGGTDPAVIEAAAERAVRRVLGAVDGSTSA